MASCGVSYQKKVKANIVESDLNWLMQRFESNVEALDTLLSNYNTKLEECVHRDCFHGNRNPRISEKRVEGLDDTLSTKNKMAPKILPKPSNLRVKKTRAMEHTPMPNPLNFRPPRDGLTNGEKSTTSTKKNSRETPTIAGYKELLKRAYVRLVNYISCTDDISARLFQHDHLSQSELERIQEARSTARANQLLIDILLQKPIDTYRAFLDELHRTRQGHVLSMLLNTDDSDLECQHHAKLIRQHYVFLTETIEVVDSGLLSHLVAGNVLTDRERTSIATEWNRYRQVENLLWIIGRKSATEFESFLLALCRTNQRHISDTLRGTSESGNSSQLKTERISSKSSEADYSTKFDRNIHAAKRKLHRLESQYSDMPFLLRLEISAKILAMQRCNETTGEATNNHVDTVLQGFVELRKTCFVLRNERNEFADLSATVKEEKRICEDQLRIVRRDFDVLESEYSGKMSELLKLRIQHNDAQMEKRRCEAEFLESKALNERLTVKLQEAVVQLNRKNEAVLESEDFKRLKKDRERLEIQLESTKAELERQRNLLLAESESLEVRIEDRVKRIQEETEIIIEKMKLENASRVSELSRQSEIDKMTAQSLHNEIARLSKYVSELEHENRRIRNELKIEKKKTERVQSAGFHPRYEARHLGRLDIPGTWVEGAAEVDDKLYLICRGSSNLAVYTAERPHSRLYSISIAGMMGPIDIVACPARRCLYIADSGARCVWRVSSVDGRHDRWLSDVTWPYTLSATGDGRVVITKRPSSLDVYDAESRLVTSTRLPQSVLDPWHAVETPTGTYLIVHGDKVSQRHGLTEISPTGQVIRSCGNLPGKEPGYFDRPRYLALLPEGGTLVADCGNNRIVLLDANLNPIQVLLKKDDNDLRNPLRICCNGSRSTLVVNNGVLDTYSFVKSVSASTL